VQWADDGFWDVVQTLAPALKAQRLLLVLF